MKTLEADLLGESVSRIVDALQATLYDLNALYLIARQCHWNVRGRMFRTLHEHYEEIYKAAAEYADEVAERITVLGAAPNGQAADIHHNATLQAIPGGFLKDEQSLDLMTQRVESAIRSIRERMDAFEDADPVTADLIHEVLAGLEKHNWMLRAQQG